MSYPELYSDERVVLQAQNVKVKSVTFEVVLTTRRLVLIDTKKNSIPPQEINLATLKDVESGENAIRDPTITISIITISGNTRQMVLTFSKTSGGGERRRECDDWVRALRQNITTTVYHPVSQMPPPRDAGPSPAVQPPSSPPPAPPEQPVHAPHRIDITNTPPPKKRIEVARPVKKIVEPAPVMPVPVETSSLPTGSFCNRCGNRVPPDSAFCNRCGTPVVQETAAGSDVIPPAEEAGTQQPAPATVPQVQVMPSPIYPVVSDKKDRPIEEVIHSIEPLIEDSVPRTAPAPLVPAKQLYHPPAAEPSAEPTEIPAAEPAGPAPGAPETAPAAGDVQWPVLSKSGVTDPAASPIVPPTESTGVLDSPAVPPSPITVPPAVPRKKTPVVLIAVAAIVIIALIAGIFLFMQGPGGTPAVSPMPTETISATPVPATAVQTTMEPRTIPTTIRPAPSQPTAVPAAQVPGSGVWVRISYTGKYTGSLGTPGRLNEVVLGKNLYQIPTSDGPVVVSLQKSDGSSAELAVDIYKDGTLMKHLATSAPKGIIENQVSLKTESAPTVIAGTTIAK